jgi:hypothetical protein
MENGSFKLHDWIRLFCRFDGILNWPVPRSDKPYEPPTMTQDEEKRAHERMRLFRHDDR